MADRRQTTREIADLTGGKCGGLSHVVTAAAAQFDSLRERFGYSRDVVTLSAG